MPQLSLYLDESTMESVRAAAAARNTTLSKYVSGVLREREEEDHRWPQSFFDLYGSCSDEDLAAPADVPYDLQPVAPLDLE